MMAPRNPASRARASSATALSMSLVASSATPTSRSGSVPQSSASQWLYARQRAGVRAVAQEHLAVDDRGEDPAGALLEALGPPGQVVVGRGELGTDALGVEHHEIGAEPLLHEATVVETPERRGVEGEHAHALLPRERLLAANPVRQEER